MTSKPTWRLIDTGEMDGPSAMAMDEALLSCFDPGSSLPVLRLYGWNPPALSLGRFQKAAEVLDLQRCVDHNVPVVRRITGGGIIYHAAELTYSIVCAPHHLTPALSIKESFRVLTTFLLNFYRILGLDACYAVDHFAADAHLGHRVDFCFAGNESYDIVIDGRKIGGNAQRRMKNVIFQHGSIPLWDRTAEGTKFLLSPDVPVRATALALEGIHLSAEELKPLMVTAFAESSGCRLVTDSPATEETECAERLRKEKYGCVKWNHDGVV